MKIKLMASFLLVLSLTFTICLSVMALENGQYVVSNTTYYVNPNTGHSEDGGDVSIGEAMARNAVKEVTLYEKSASGQSVTLRLGQSSFIKNIAIKVDGRSVSHEVTGKNENENTIDLRFSINSETSLIQPSFFVGPMDRDVTFYVKINANSAKNDAASLAKFGVELKEEKIADIKESPAVIVSKPEMTEKPNAASTPKVQSVPTPETTAPPSPAAEQQDAITEEQPEQSIQPEYSTQPEETEEPAGIVEFPVETPVESRNTPSAIWAIAAVVVVCLVVAGGYYLRRRVFK